MIKDLKKRFITPKEVEEVYSIPQGSLANMRWAKKGPKYYKAGSRRVMYLVDDVEAWLSRNPVLTTDSIENN